MRDVLRGLWGWIMMIGIEIMFGYLAITGQGPVALLSLGIIGLNTLCILDTIYQIADEIKDMVDEIKDMD